MLPVLVAAMLLPLPGLRQPAVCTARLWLPLVCITADVAVAAAGLHQTWHRTCSQAATTSQLNLFQCCVQGCCHAVGPGLGSRCMSVACHCTIINLLLDALALKGLRRCHLIFESILS